MRAPSEYDYATEPRRRRSSGWRTTLKVGALLFLAVFIGTLAGAALLWQKWSGGKSSLGDMFHTVGVLVDPAQAFPGQDRLTVLCLGLDRNIFTTRDPKLKHLNGMPYTKGSRSDVMMVASLDLKHQAVSILSIPRDTRVILPGKSHYSKINQAHADGGIPYTMETVEQFLGCKLDHYVVIKQEAIQHVVDSLGGVKVKVPHDMDYDDSWGQLHIHLREGEQVLNGEQAVGFMRFRHDREGDFGRIKRQQQVIQTLGQEAKSPAVIAKAPGLIDAIRKYVQTDLTPDQQLALAKLFNKMDPANIQTAQLPVLDTATIRNVSYVIPDDDRKEAAVDWIIHGNPDAMNRMIRVEMLNASGDPELYGKVYDCLRHYGFNVVRAGRARGKREASHAVQHSAVKGAARQVLKVLGVNGTVEKGADAVTDVTLYVGQDLANSRVLAMADLWPPIPEHHRVELVEHRSAASGRRSRHHVDPSAAVDIKPAAPEAAPTSAPQIAIPGAAEPRGNDASPGAGAQPSSPAPAPDSSGDAGRAPAGTINGA